MFSPLGKRPLLAVLLKKNGYPPMTIDDTYDDIMKQVENYSQLTMEAFNFKTFHLVLFLRQRPFSRSYKLPFAE
jgi:hypothetical protein